MRASTALLFYTAVVLSCVLTFLCGAALGKGLGPGLPRRGAAHLDPWTARLLIAANNVRNLLLTAIPGGGIPVGYWAVFATGAAVGARAADPLAEALSILATPHAVLEVLAHSLVLSRNILLFSDIVVRGRAPKRRDVATYVAALAAASAAMVVAAFLEVP